jgi:multidrug efflux pump subunit AcrB
VIIVDNGEAPASQTLVSVTRPIEEAMNGVPGIARIKSKTARGSSEISLYFDWNVKIVEVLQLVQARLSQLSSTLPPTAQIRNVERLTFAVFPVAGYSLTSDKRDQASLRDIATYIIRPQLRVCRGGDCRGGRWQSTRVPRGNRSRSISRAQRLSPAGL